MRRGRRGGTGMGSIFTPGRGQVYTDRANLAHSGGDRPYCGRAEPGRIVIDPRGGRQTLVPRPAGGNALAAC